MATILDKLAAENVFNIDKNNSTEFTIWESCDYFFKITITKAELQQLIHELQALHDED